MIEDELNFMIKPLEVAVPRMLTAAENRLPLLIYTDACMKEGD